MPTLVDWNLRMPFQNIYKGKTVLVTGHTGFKGSWLTLWLKELGANVIGISKDIPTIPSHFQLLELEKDINHIILDVTNKELLQSSISSYSPDFIFHLAAQPLVNESYKNPTDTFLTNVMGVNNVLESVRLLNKQCACIIVTSDKCYDNIDIKRGYRENDILGGKDPYSASKGAAELVFKGYFHSFFKNQTLSRVVTARAGNVIGGGDWAKNRIIPDCIRAWESGENVQIRNPNATRPWQHVLEPLSGYLHLGYLLWTDSKYNGESYNFGPNAGESSSVVKLIDKMSHAFYNGGKIKYDIIDDESFHEASLLALDCNKAKSELGWSQTLSYDELCALTADWYKNYKSQICKTLTITQINTFTMLAKNRGLTWAN